MSGPGGGYPSEANCPEVVKVNVKVASKLSKPSTDNLVEKARAFNPFLSALVRTTQVTQIFSSTILSAVVTSCVPASLFVKDNPTLCSRRKRRDLIMLMDFDKAQQMQGEQDDVIAPSEVNQ